MAGIQERIKIFLEAWPLIKQRLQEDEEDEITGMAIEESTGFQDKGIAPRER